MSDEEEKADSKSNKRNRLKGAVARTRTRLTKKQTEQSTTVDDFLASGRSSTSLSLSRPSVSESFSYEQEDKSATPPNTRPAQPREHVLEVPHASDHVPPPQHSPRRIIVPKIDVSNSQRYPAAQSVEETTGDGTQQLSLLRPEFKGRGPSISSLSKGPGRARGLSVQFTDYPPVVIGEGGDEAEAPPLEIGRAKARSRSASPPRAAGSQGTAARLWNKSPLPSLPRPGTTSPKPPPQNASRSPQPRPGQPGLKRVQTGMVGLAPSPVSESRQAMDREFEMSMGISPVSTNSSGPSQTTAAETPVLYAPKPVHPPAPYPNVKELPLLHDLRSQHGTVSLRKKYAANEGQTFREAHQSPSTEAAQDSEQTRFPSPGSTNSQRAQDIHSAHGKAMASDVGSVRLVQPSQQTQQMAPPPAYTQPGPNQGARYYPPPPKQPVSHVYQVSNAPQQPLPPPPSYPPPRQKLPPPPPPLSAPQRAAEDEYVGWVPDSASQEQPQAHAFPGVDSSGKLAAFPGVDEEPEHDGKSGKSKRRWFRRGS
jgi:hypothetical protein